MISSEFNCRKEIIYRYFHHTRWNYKGDDGWEYEYYKGKKNLEELENAINIVFDSTEVEIIHKCWFYNDKNEIVGATVICDFDIIANFNGINQGEDSGKVYVAFTLARFGFFYKQSSDLELLKNKL